VNISDTTKYYTTEENRVVYGGGGIMPDVFIPIDTTLFNNTFYANALQFIPRFVYTEYENYKTDLEKFKSMQTMNSQFEVTDKIFNDFLALVKSEDIKIDAKEMAAAKSILKKRIKAYFARQAFRDNGYFYIMNSDDKMMKAALENLK
jgi:carboxyl-terminal processing protease